MQKILKSKLSFVLLAALSFAMTSVAHAKKNCCPKCSTPCTLKVEEGTEEKHCWNIKSKTVCIPKVRFSWQWPWDPKTSCASKGCDQNCDGGCGKCLPPIYGRSRTICVLEKHTYECPKCKYTWEPLETNSCGNGGCTTGCCDSSACAKADVEPLKKTIVRMPFEVQTASAEAKKPKQRSLFSLPIKVSEEAKKLMQR